ncbi:hypothetical protein H311_02472, partial [Anncaliia algerae PRA109]
MKTKKHIEEVEIIVLDKKEDPKDIVIIKTEIDDKSNKELNGKIIHENDYYSECSCINTLDDSECFSFTTDEDSYQNECFSSVENNFLSFDSSESTIASLDDDLNYNEFTLLPIGMSNDEINRLNRFTYNQMITNINLCSICYTDFNSTDTVIELDCLHIYHCSCIIQWLMNN